MWRPACLAQFLAAGLLLTTPVHAEDTDVPPPAWQGVWHGTIGKAEVQACLQHEDYDDFGAYYYMRHLGVISLGTVTSTMKPDAPVWTEAPDADEPGNGPLWLITSMTGDHLHGLWTSRSKTLPIDLTRVAVDKPGSEDNNNGPCGSLAFNLPRFTQPVITAKPAVLDGVTYSRIIADPGPQFSSYDFETFQLQGATAGIQHVNAELYKAVPIGPDADYFQCSVEALGHSGRDGESSSTQTPLIISKSWLVVEDSEYGYCGGPYPASATDYQTWDLHTGSTVNLDDWFNVQALQQTVNEPGTADQYTTVTYTAPFRKMIDDAYPNNDDADCKQAELEADSWTVHPTATGFDFSPELPHAVQACIDDAIVPFSKLGSYLSPAGKAGVASFTAEVKASK